MPSSTSTTATDPAIKSYFFGKGYRDLWATIVTAWHNNWASASGYWKRGQALFSTGAGTAWMAAWWFGASLSVVLFGTTFTLMLSLLHILFLGVFFGVIYLGFSVVALFERAAMLLRGFVSVCPNCHSRLALPTYICDGCGAEHPRLIPSSFGILWHRCRCGTKLPCTLFNNRGRLKSKCLTCHSMLEREHTETRKQFLPIIGGPSVGKSAYLFALSQHLRDHTAPALGMTAKFIDSAQERSYQSVVAGIRAGRPPNKTAATLPKAYDLLFSHPSQPAFALYLYDPAGEAFLDSTHLVQHQFLDYLSGIIVLLDPFAIPDVRNHYASELNSANDIRPSNALAEDTLARLVNSMESQFGLRPNDKVKVPVAVVINKVDAFDLEQVIGEEALTKIPSLSGENREQRRNRLIRERLADWGQTTLVQQIETRFSNIHYFTVSALGRPAVDRPTEFVPKRVAEPALWILGQSNRILK